MRRNQRNELSGRYDFGFLPEFREMFHIAGNQVVRTGSIGALQKSIVVRVGCDLKAPTRSHDMTAVLDELQQLLPKALANVQFRAGEDVAVFFQDEWGDVPARRFRHGEQEDGALQPSRFEGSGHQHVCVNDKTEGKHHRFRFWEREILMIRSIWRPVKVLVPARSDSHPMTLRTSGSGAASFT